MRKNLRPQQMALILVAGFIDGELFFLGQGLEQRLIDGLERLADFGQHPRRKGHT